MKSAPEVKLYTRQGCHLCDDAKAVLARHGLVPQEIDIDVDPQLVERYTTCVPVVEIDGKERFRGRVDEVLLRRLLRGRGE
jgi:glutaredoxin